MNRFLVAIGVVAALAALAVPAVARKKKNKKSNAAAVALFEKAIAASDIEAKGSSAFRLQATADVINGQRKVAGTLTEFWTPDKQKRTEILFRGYSYLKVSLGRDSWTKTNDPYMPYPISQLLAFVDLGIQLRAALPPRPSAAHVSKTRQKRRREENRFGKVKNKQGGRWKCVRAPDSQNAPSQFCFDSETGNLTEIFAEHGLRYEYGDYRPFGTKSYPRTMRILYADGTEMAELHVTQIVPLKKPDPALFLPPPGSQEAGAGMGVCGDSVPNRGKVKPVKPIKKVYPKYPLKAAEERISGKVIIHALIGKDGAPHALWVLKSPSPLLSAAALQAVAQWRYQPALLCGRKVHVNTTLAVVFNLQ